MNFTPFFNRADSTLVVLQQSRDSRCTQKPRPFCAFSETTPVSSNRNLSRWERSSRRLQTIQVRTNFVLLIKPGTSRYLRQYLWSYSPSAIGSDSEIASISSLSSRSCDIASASAANASSSSERISIRHPVSRAASLAFKPSLPIASGCS